MYAVFLVLTTILQELIRGMFRVTDIVRMSEKQYYFTTKRKISAQEEETEDTCMHIIVLEKESKWKEMIQRIAPPQQQQAKEFASLPLKSLFESQLPVSDVGQYSNKPVRHDPIFVAHPISTWSIGDMLDWLAMFDYNQKGLTLADALDLDNKSIGEKIMSYPLQQFLPPNTPVQTIETMLKQKLNILDGKIVSHLAYKLHQWSESSGKHIVLTINFLPQKQQDKNTNFGLHTRR